MTSDMWLGIGRHFLTLIGGIFVAKGYVDSDTMNTVVGAVSTLVGAGLSIADKKGR